MKNILITAGPTHEPIDPVRFIGNRSSGKMGFALAKAFLELGCKVNLITGPTQLDLSHPHLSLQRIETAEEMFNAVCQHLETYHLAILSAAVADFTPINVASQKIKKAADQTEMQLSLTKTKDILAHLGDNKNEKQVLVGFSLETHEAEKFARQKLAKKNCDFIVMNSLKDAGAGFGFDTNKISLLGKNNFRIDWPLLSKIELGSELANFFLKRI